MRSRHSPDVKWQQPTAYRRVVTSRRLLERIQRGNLRNVRFTDAQRLTEALGFELRRTSGSHHIFVHPGLGASLNLQNVGGEAKPYQLRQFVRLVERYGLKLEDRA